MPCNATFDLILFLSDNIFSTLFLKISIDLIFEISKIFVSASNLNSFNVLFLYTKNIISIQPMIIYNEILFKSNKILKDKKKENQEIKDQPK